MNKKNDFVKQLLVCERQESKCNKWFNAWWFVGGMSIMSLLCGNILLSISLYVLWGIITFITSRQVEKYGQEVDKLGEIKD